MFTTHKYRQYIFDFTIIYYKIINKSIVISSVYLTVYTTDNIKKFGICEIDYWIFGLSNNNNYWNTVQYMYQCKYCISHPFLPFLSVVTLVNYSIGLSILEYQNLASPCDDTGLFVWRVRSHAHTSAHAQTYLRMLFVAHMKSHIQPKRSCSLNILLSILHLCLRAPSLNNAVYVNSVSQAPITTGWRPPKAEDRFCRVSSCRFLVSVFFWEPSLYCILF